jgi:hypothetical protein
LVNASTKELKIGIILNTVNPIMLGTRKSKTYLRGVFLTFSSLEGVSG